MARKINKRHPDNKGRSKYVFLFADDIILYKEKPNKSTNSLLKVTN